MHHAAWVIAPLVVVGVLALSAATKAGKGETLQSVVANLELPTWVLPRSLARAIPGIEAAIALGLLAPWAPVGVLAAAGALVLMLTYWALIARGLTISPRPACSCFGDVDQPISGRTLLRNTVLVGTAAGALAFTLSGRTVWSVLSRARSEDWWWLAFTALACVVTALVLGASSRTVPAPTSATPLPEPTSAVIQPQDDPGIDRDRDSDSDEEDYLRAPTPELLLLDPASEPVTLLELSATRAQLLIFVNCYCASTREAIAAREGWQDRLDLVDVRIVFSVPILEQAIPVTPPGTLVDHAGLAWRSLGLVTSPSALLLGADGYLAGGPVAGPTEVTAFIDEIAEALSDTGSQAHR